MERNPPGIGEGRNQMNFGIMWKRADNTPLAADIQAAMAHIKKKYGMTPSRCLVSAKDNIEEVDVAGLSVEQSSFIQKSHIWLGGKPS